MLLIKLNHLIELKEDYWIFEWLEVDLHNIFCWLTILLNFKMFFDFVNIFISLFLFY